MSGRPGTHGETGRGLGAASGVLVADDPSVHEDAVRPWELISSPLQGGPFRYRMHYLVTESFVLYDETFDSRVRLRGQSPPDVLAFSIPICSPSDSKYWKAPLGSPCLPAMLPGAVDVELAAGHRHLVVLVDASLLRRHLAPAQVKAIEVAAAAHRLPCSEPRIQALRDWLLGVIHEAAVRGQAPHHAAALGALGADLVRHLGEVATLPHTERGRPAVAQRHRDLARVLDYLRAAGPVDATIPELCQSLQVSQRSLEYAFRETFDLSPVAFLRLRRLHATRRRLMAADPANMSVTDILTINHIFAGRLRRPGLDTGRRSW